MGRTITVKDLASTLPANRVTADNSAVGERVVSTAYTSDLLSDVMANAAEGAVLVTIQAHKNTVAVSALIGMPAIIVCNNRPIPADMVAAADSEQIAILSSPCNQFQVSGRLWALLGGEPDPPA